MKVMKAKHSQQGITIIEVLVAMLILAVGLLGMASLQVRAVQDTSNASHRSIAIFYANDMADRIRANSGQVYTNGAGSTTGGCLTTTGCTSLAMRNNDLAEWRANLAQTLPVGTGEIARNGNVYTVTVRWNDRVEAENNAGTDVTTATSSVQISFQP